jgi:hypothetical protein
MRAGQGAAGFLGLSLLAFLVAMPAWAQETVHGANSLFVSPTLKIAWAMRKGTTEETTTVVIRVVNSTGAYRQIGLDGVDPFSKQRTTLVAAQPLATLIDLSISRARFAEYPSCEIQLYQSEQLPTDRHPNLTVFYLGVPDTTPEFATAQAMEEYFTKVIWSAK